MPNKDLMRMKTMMKRKKRVRRRIRLLILKMDLMELEEIQVEGGLGREGICIRLMGIMPSRVD